VHANVSPTYAFPKAGGRVRSGERTKASFETAEDLEGQASDAAGFMDCASAEEDDGAGRGCWVAKEGRESLQWLISVLMQVRNN
jgi:hypothetical protein